MKFPEKHPNHPVNRRPRSPNNIPIAKPQPNSSDTNKSSGNEVSHHAQVSSTPPSEDAPKLRFDYSYYSGPPGVGNGRLDWMLDSGTTSHFVKWKDQFQSFTVKDPPIRIDTAAGPSSLTGFAIGDVPLTVASGPILLRNVIYTPHLHTNCNLLSMAALDSEGFTVTFSEKKAFITRRSDNLLWATGSLRSNLYFLDALPHPSVFSLTPSLEDTQILETWHKRLGHLSARNITRLQRISNGIKIGTPPSLIKNADCVDCLKSAQHRLPSHVPTRGASVKLGVVHCDTCGPMKMTAIGGKENYFLVFVDDFTRMVWVYGLEAKSDAFPAFQHFVAHIERECGHPLLALRSDNAGEFISTKIEDWCSERGIVLQTTQPYTPDMNGVAERVIRTIVEHASAMLWSSFLGLVFWYEAVKTAVYLKNRSPHSARDKTPYELWAGTPPSLAHLRVFGCRCYALIPDQKRTKWESHGGECLFMGYFSANNLYRLFDIGTNKFLKKRDVVFHECVLGHHGFANNRLPIGMDIMGMSVVNANDSFEDVVVTSTDQDQIVSNYLGFQSVPQSIHLATSLRPPLVPRHLPSAMTSPDSDKWKQAMVTEISALERNHTWDIVPLPSGKTALGCKWVFALRPDTEGNLTRYKARLVSRGDLQLDHEFHETFAPVAKFCSLKILLSIAAYYDLEIDQGDFDSAFVNGTLDEEIYMSQPPGFSTSNSDSRLVLKLHKSLYGLKQAARIWYQTLDSLLKQFNFKRVMVDYGVWVHHETKTLILAHVDDMILVGSRHVLDDLKPKINAVYAFKDLGPASLFLGIRITRDRTKRCVYLNQGQYATSVLHKYNVLYPASTPLSSSSEMHSNTCIYFT